MRGRKAEEASWLSCAAAAAAAAAAAVYFLRSAVGWPVLDGADLRLQIF